MANQDNKTNHADLVEESIKNIRSDREKTMNLLEDLKKHITGKNQEYSHRDVGMILAKYVETLQRSNDQLVKLIGITKRKEESEDFTEEDREGIFEVLNTTAKSQKKRA